MISNSAGNYRGIRYLERSKLSLISTLVINHKDEREAPIIGVKRFFY